MDNERIFTGASHQTSTALKTAAAMANKASGEQSPIPAALCNLEAGCQNLDRMIETLELRLDPLMRGPFPEVVRDKDGESQSLIHAQILQMGASVGIASYRIGRLLDRLTI